MKKRTKRLLVAGPLVVVAILIAGGLWIWHMMGRPLFRPGMVRVSENLRAPLSPPPQGQDPNTWLVEKDIELYHFSTGNGPPVLFIRGGPGFPVRRVPAGLKLLEADYEVHLYDQRGCGRSTRPFDRFSSPNLYENMLALDRTLGIGAQLADIERIRRLIGQKKLILIGHSFGGFLASLYAAEFPERVQAVVLVAPADMIVFPSQSGSLFELMGERLPREVQEEYARFADEYTDFSNVFTKSEQDLAAMNREFGRFFLLASGDDPNAKLTELVATGNGGWMVTAMYFGLGKRHDYRDQLRSVDAPVLIVYGDRDLGQRSASREYAKVLANAQVEVIRGAGHFLLEENPTELADVIRAFLGNIGPGR